MRGKCQIIRYFRFPNHKEFPFSIDLWYRQVLQEEAKKKPKLHFHINYFKEWEKDISGLNQEDKGWGILRDEITSILRCINMHIRL
jgi:hypothetical protein